MKNIFIYFVILIIGCIGIAYGGIYLREHFMVNEGIPFGSDMYRQFFIACRDIRALEIELDTLGIELENTGERKRQDEIRAARNHIIRTRVDAIAQYNLERKVYTKIQFDISNLQYTLYEDKRTGCIYGY